MKKLFLIVGLLLVIIGALWLLLPAVMLDAWGVSQPNSVTLYMSSRAGALLLGFAVIFCLVSRSGKNAIWTAFFTGGAVTFGILTILSVWGFLSGVVGPAIWSATVVEFIMTVAFIYSLYSNRLIESTAT